MERKKKKKKKCTGIILAALSAHEAMGTEGILKQFIFSRTWGFPMFGRVKITMLQLTLSLLMPNVEKWWWKRMHTNLQGFRPFDTLEIIFLLYFKNVFYYFNISIFLCLWPRTHTFTVFFLYWFLLIILHFRQRPHQWNVWWYSVS